MDVAELAVEELDFVEEDLPEEEPEDVTVEVDVEVVDMVELETPVADDEAVDGATEDAQETAVGTVTPLVEHSWSAKVIVAAVLSIAKMEKAARSQLLF